ncbi:hypothetical protein [Mycobacterium sp. 94-17]|uniref:hypothetical protein n=1 Tax=Mycobacterium sp. 94-17 TaxID=2986147 RepID=UPI002D1EFE9D|nr:hypothetical protein [Mycobacterium sp. 94-17]MEB4212162.1 hypothetical protein [Mycobacterium sp. 94-17]
MTVAVPRVRVEPDSEAFAQSAVDRADRWLLAGTLCCGSIVLAPAGLVLLLIGTVKLHRARSLGWVRPLAVTLIAVFALVDGGINWLGWSLDVFAHDTHVLRAMSTGFGKMIDGGYYWNYNSTHIGGTFDRAEKAMALFSVLCIFPARMAAAWAFLKLRRWGLRWMIITGWAYVFLWVGYLANLMMNFPHRFGNTLYGVTGWWVFDIFYMTPFIQLPWLYALDKRRWNK